MLSLPMRHPFLFVGVLVATGLPACKDASKHSVEQAGAHAEAMAKLAEADVLEVERGLPEGAKTLATLMARGDEVRGNLDLVKKELQKVRRDVPDLLVAKSTFFALTDDKGIAIRNNLEQDAMARQDLVALFPELAKARDGKYVTTTGTFPGPAGPAGPDRDWIAAAPVSRDGKVAGIFVTGWTYRSFARHLQENLKRDIAEKARRDDSKLPIIYVGVFDKNGVYMSPLTPKADEDFLAAEQLVEKTQAGPKAAAVNITDRVFGYGAARVPKLGPDMGVVVLRSEI
jgi:hypothetical protein